MPNRASTSAAPRERRAYPIRRVRLTLEDVVAEGPTFSESNIVRTAGESARIFASLIEREPQEVFCAIGVNGKHRPVAYREITRGTISNSIVTPPGVFGWALAAGSIAALIIAHNHPSGDPEPSAEDLAVTRRLIDCGRLLGLPILDHVIIGADGAFVSLRERMEF